MKRIPCNLNDRINEAEENAIPEVEDEEKEESLMDPDGEDANQACADGGAGVDGKGDGCHGSADREERLQDNPPLGLALGGAQEPQHMQMPVKEQNPAKHNPVT